MKLYNLAREGQIESAKKIQFQMLDLIEVMLLGVDFPEGFRAGMTVRGFNMGRGRQHQSNASQANIENITRTIQCLIAEHGLVATPPGGCDLPAIDQQTVQDIVVRVMAQLSR